MSSIATGCYYCGRQEPVTHMEAACVVDGQVYREPFDICPVCRVEWEPTEWCVECERRIEDCACVRCDECRGLSEECECWSGTNVEDDMFTEKAAYAGER